MTAEEINRFKTLVGPNFVLKLLCDNNLTFFSGPVETYSCIWDDTNGVFYQIRPNVSPHTQVTTPAEITVVPYENIQNITIVANMTQTIDLLTNLGKTTEEINSILQNLKVFGDIKPSTHIRSNDAYADGHIEEQE